MDDFLDFLKVMFPVFLITLFIMGSCTVGVNEYSRYKCNNYAKIAGKLTRYANFDICYIETADGFQRWDEYKVRALASEGLKE